MPSKAPIYLKPNSGKSGIGSGRGSNKLRELLSADMISLPIGDFKHVAHVGRGGAGDMFGDIPFINQKNANGTTNNNKPRERHEGLLSLQSIRRKAKATNKSRTNSVPESEEAPQETKHPSKQHVGYGPLESPTLKSAFDLPLIEQQKVTNRSEKQNKDKNTKTVTNNNLISNNKSYKPKTPFTTSDEDKFTPNGLHYKGLNQSKELPTSTESNLPSDTTSIDEGWALDLDLGTSLMDDVLGIMDKIEL